MGVDQLECQAGSEPLGVFALHVVDDHPDRTNPSEPVV
jgi:hypothetical protein